MAVYGSNEPIAAIASPMAESALAIIRSSGGLAASEGGIGSLEILAKIFSRPLLLRETPGNSVIHGWILDPFTKEKIDEVLVSVYRAPASYTGEDGADICCHGGIAVVKAVFSALKKAGFREALPGEFTFRAFMNGKLDLTRAESVMELVAAKTDKGREQAIRRLAGTLEKEISAIKTTLVEVLAGAEICLDYSEDEFFADGETENSGEEKGRMPKRNLAEEAASRLKALAELWRRERIYSEGALAVIAGRPNAGKSSLFNYLIREDRSIVTDIPGTTRDWIEAHISLDGIPLRLADTAGLRPGQADYEKAGEAERIGIQRSLELLDKASLVLYLVDGQEGITDDDRDFILKRKEKCHGKALLILWNKADLAPLPVSLSETGNVPGVLSEHILPISAKTGEGIKKLLSSAVLALEAVSGACVSESGSGNAAGPGSERQKELIDTCIDSLEEALALDGKNEPLDIIAPLLRSAVNALGEITGEVSTADILETMFSNFCVGK
ncbi:MAG: tRNA uridine-5-carboxymethylaminomethyl(34) synthesis GTPase MnmE [Treponema sp.]|nr:tRNA uridine-5-carboxymethylaminomethyl(34) synthesis GTPase MnmE [Treponema sp.]